MFDTQLSDTLVDSLRQGRLSLRNFFAPPAGRADDFCTAPGQHAGDGVEVGGVGVAADTRSLERDGATTREGVAHARTMAVAQDAQLLHQL